MNWDDLKVVLAIHRSGSVSGAAQMLGIDPSTAGRRLTAIERDLGTILFSRSKRGLTATDAGEVVIKQAVEIELRAERIVDKLPQEDASPTGSVCLLSNPWILTQLATFGLAELRSSHPDIELVMIASTRRRSVALGETDLALWFEVMPEDGEFAIPLCDVPYALYAPADRDPEAVDWMTIWNVKDRIEPMRWMAEQLPADHPMALKANDPPALLGAIAAGLGKALIPVCMGNRDPRVVRLRNAMPDVVRKLHLHTHPDLVQSPRIQAVMAWIRAVVPQVLGDPEASRPAGGAAAKAAKTAGARGANRATASSSSNGT